jgi:integrase/recombinase XerD
MNLQQLIERYISYRQALGEKFGGGAAILRAFGRTVGSQVDIGGVRAEQIAAFLAAARPITNYWHNKYRALFGFYSFAKSRGHVTEVPLPAKPPKQLPPFVPYIYSREELRRLLDAAGCYQRGESALDPVTFRTILLLLYGTGLRDGEVIRLNPADVDLDNSLLTVRLTKFHKSRLVPFGPQVCQILTEYANSRTAPVVRPGEETPFFTTRKGTRIVLNTLQAHFRRVRAQSGIRRTDGARYQPRLHDLRHAFAVHRLTSWYQQGADVQNLVFQLSVYLGHAHLADTQAYLSMTPDLLREANALFECYAERGGQP